MAMDNAGNIVRDKGAKNKKESDKGPKGGRGMKYNCGECHEPKQGHVCPCELVDGDINTEYLESFVKLVTELVSEMETLTLRLPSLFMLAWRNEGEAPTQHEDNAEDQAEVFEAEVDEDESENISESEVNTPMNEEDNEE
jgi:hypothetical protein